MMYAAIAASWALVLLLLWVLLASQPAGLAEVYARDQAQATEVARLRAAVPTPTPVRCYSGTSYGYCYP